MTDFLCSQFDLTRGGLLPPDWDRKIHELAVTHGVQTRLDGKSSTSREPQKAEGCIVVVVTGDVIQREMPWLDSIYRGVLLDYVATTTSKKIVPATDLRCAVNINLLRGFNSRYEWHVDSNPLTGILYVTNHDPSTGGELVFENGSIRKVVWPRKGLFIAFDAHEMPHAVMPLKSDMVRISVPMNYFIEGKLQERPSDLDQYIYSQDVS